MRHQFDQVLNTVIYNPLTAVANTSPANIGNFATSFVSLSTLLNITGAALLVAVALRTLNDNGKCVFGNSKVGDWRPLSYIKGFKFSSEAAARPSSADEVRDAKSYDIYKIATRTITTLASAAALYSSVYESALGDYKGLLIGTALLAYNAKSIYASVTSNLSYAYYSAKEYVVHTEEFDQAKRCASQAVINAKTQGRAEGRAEVVDNLKQEAGKLGTDYKYSKGQEKDGITPCFVTTEVLANMVNTAVGKTIVRVEGSTELSVIK